MLGVKRGLGKERLYAGDRSVSVDADEGRAEALHEARDLHGEVDYAVVGLRAGERGSEKRDGCLGQSRRDGGEGEAGRGGASARPACAQSLPMPRLPPPLTAGESLRELGRLDRRDRAGAGRTSLVLHATTPSKLCSIASMSRKKSSWSLLGHALHHSPGSVCAFMCSAQ